MLLDQGPDAANFDLEFLQGEMFNDPGTPERRKAVHEYAQELRSAR